MALDYDFCADMDARKQAAMDRRNRGRPTGKPAKGWNARAPLPEDNETNRLYAELADVRAELREAQTAAARGTLEPIDDYGAEFDKLLGRGLPAPPHVTASHSKAREGTKGNTMTNKQYLDALKKLGLTPSGKATARALGLSLRQCQRIAAGDCEVPETVALLLRMYLKHGIPTP